MEQEPEKPCDKPDLRQKDFGMPVLTVRHRTTYSYRGNVELAPHRLMLRPREGKELRLLTHDFSISPDAQVDWSTDVFGNSVATATFGTPTNSLTIDSLAEVDVTAPPWPVYNLSAAGASYPFRYSAEEWTDLGALAAPGYADRSGRLQAWAQGFVAGQATDTLSLLQDLNSGVFDWISYQSREDEGTQAPLETLDRTWGSCRDLAVLFVESVRCLGLGARVVSGYLWNTQGSVGSWDRGSTHAWAEVFLPGAGWVPFDPTNRKMGGEHLIPVATGRTIAQIIPVAGSFVGPSDAFMSMQVDVEVASQGDKDGNTTRAT
jgi:transglutaminase-like putative cysteine protease